MTKGKEMSAPIYMNLSLTQDQIVSALASSEITRDELLDLLTALDLMIAEVDFTEELVKRLVKSLKSDHEDVDLPFIDWKKVK
jgi:hypothetical protein